MVLSQAAAISGSTTFLAKRTRKPEEPQTQTLTLGLGGRPYSSVIQLALPSMAPKPLCKRDIWLSRLSLLSSLIGGMVTDTYWEEMLPTGIQVNSPQEKWLASQHSIYLPRTGREGTFPSLPSTTLWFFSSLKPSVSEAGIWLLENPTGASPSLVETGVAF